MVERGDIDMEITFRKAEVSDTKMLRNLAFSSEQFWGYDGRFMEIFDKTFNITPDFIKNHPVYVGFVPDSSEPVCFWGMIPDGDCGELEYFYTQSSRLKKGYGRLMWNHLTDWCRRNRIRTLTMVTSPQAVGFYEKMGAYREGTRNSSIDGRKIPFLVFHPDAPDDRR